MKRTVWTFGLIAGGIMSAMMILTFPFHEQFGDAGVVVGYTTMVFAFLLIYFGVRSYRDRVAGGTVRFGKALGVGLLIALIASSCYVATWEVYFFNFAQDFPEKYAARVLEKARMEGQTDEQIAALTKQMDGFKVMYRNPVMNVALTYLEPLPVAVVMSLVSAGVLSRKKATAA